MNPADLCRECEVRQSVKELEEAGDRIAGLVQEVFDMITFDSKLKNAIEDWKKVREESGMSEVLIMPKILIHENEDLKIKNSELLQKVQQLEIENAELCQIIQHLKGEDKESYTRKTTTTADFDHNIVIGTDKVEL